MAVKFIGPIARIICLSTDTKPTAYPNGEALPWGSELTEKDTQARFMFDGVVWFPVRVFKGGSYYGR